MVKISAACLAAIPAAIERCREKYNLAGCDGERRSNEKVAAWLVLDKTSGKIIQDHTGGYVCHGGMQKEENALILLSTHINHQGKHPDFTKWICRESPFSHAVVNADKEDEILGGAVIVDAEICGPGGALWLGKALRYCVEDNWRPGLWDLFTGEGVGGLAAFIGASIITRNGEPSRGCTHNSLYGYPSVKGFGAWLKRDGVKWRNDSHHNTSSSGNFDRNWGSLGSKEMKVDDGWGGYAIQKVPSDHKEFCKKLKLIEKGDYDNV